MLQSKKAGPRKVCPRRNLNAPFVAIDFETADYGQDSACALALVRVENLQIVRREYALIRPPRSTFFFSYLHGITWEHVADQPTFAEIWPELNRVLDGVEFLGAHNAGFDRAVLRACCLRGNFVPPEIPFECTVALARRTWNIRPTKLPHVCNFLGIPLNHHDARSDAEACARIIMEAGRCKIN
jgi:DNA polymerase III subunit epsilon